MTRPDLPSGVERALLLAVYAPLSLDGVFVFSEGETAEDEDCGGDDCGERGSRVGVSKEVSV